MKRLSAHGGSHRPEQRVSHDLRWEYSLVKLVIRAPADAAMIRFFSRSLCRAFLRLSCSASLPKPDVEAFMVDDDDDIEASDVEAIAGSAGSERVAMSI